MKETKQNIWRFLISFCIILMMFFSFGLINTNAEENKEELVVGVPIDRCPIFYVDKDSKEVTGIGVELMKIAAENAGYKVSFTAIKEATIKDALDSDFYDVVMPFGSAVAGFVGSNGSPNVIP